MVGLSMGGPIMLNLNARWPDIARSMVFADSFARIRPGADDRKVQKTRQKGLSDGSRRNAASRERP